MEAKSNSYSVIIDVFRKGTYRVYSYRMVDGNFEAIKFSANKKLKTIINKSLTPVEAKIFEQYIYSFPLEKLKAEYINENVRGEYHIKYHITIGNKQKSIFVYFYRQNDLAELYKRLCEFVPIDERLLYY